METASLRASSGNKFQYLLLQKQINITTFVQQIETTTVMKQWLTGISYECAFWNSLYRNKEQRERLFRWSNYGRELSLHNFDATSFLDERSTKIHTDAIILDVGCGMSYCTGNLLHGNPIDIHYIDPLAPFFNRILQRSHVNCPPIELG